MFIFSKTTKVVKSVLIKLFYVIMPNIIFLRPKIISVISKYLCIGLVSFFSQVKKIITDIYNTTSINILFINFFFFLVI